MSFNWPIKQRGNERSRRWCEGEIRWEQCPGVALGLVVTRMAIAGIKDLSVLFEISNPKILYGKERKSLS